MSPMARLHWAALLAALYSIVLLLPHGASAQEGLESLAHGYLADMFSQQSSSVFDVLGDLNGRKLTQNPKSPALNPQFSATMEDLVKPNGYPLLAYEVPTRDGFILTMYRIPYGRYRNNKPGKRPLVLLHHGVTLASNCFVCLNANESSAFMLADAGFDVWMANTRGNTYSRGNLKYRAQDPKYWYFGLDELALIDLPTQIDFMLSSTGAKKTAFVGHSQGCSLIYMLLAKMTEYNDKISVVAQWGPVAFVKYFRSPLLKRMAAIRGDQILKNMQWGEFLWNRIISPLYLGACKAYNGDEDCARILAYTFYGASMFITPDDYFTISTGWPSSVSTRNLEHWAQNWRFNGYEMRMYDFGTDCAKADQGIPFYESCNQRKYGQNSPPVYNLTNIRAPIAVFSGGYDVMAVPEDFSEVRRRLRPGVLVAHYQYPQYGHMDFVWDRNAKHLPDMADLFFRYSPGTF
eukprot:jgi/Chrzof1/9192/Cz03g39100.t1